MRPAIDGPIKPWFRAIPSSSGGWTKEGTRLQIWWGRSLKATFGLVDYDERTTIGPKGLTPAETFVAFIAYLDHNANL